MKYPMIVASLIAGAIGCLFILIGESTPQWVIYRKSVWAGLFVICLPECNWYFGTGEVAAARALVVIGFLLSAAGLIVLIVYYAKHITKDQTHRIFSIVTAGLYLGAAAAALIGSIIFSTAVKSLIDSAFGVRWDFGYSFALTIVGIILSGVAGVLAFIHWILQN